MELFTNNIPDGWTTTTPLAVAQDTQQGRVHSGNSSVSLLNGAILTQFIADVNPGCFYEFSFFAHSEGVQTSITATVTFITPGPDVTGATIFVRLQDVPGGNTIFGYYRALTIEAPANVTGARIDFAITAIGQQSVNLDDVSFGTQ